MSDWTDIDSDEEDFARELGSRLAPLRARGSQCPRPDLLMAGREGVLPGEIAVDVAAHVAGCPLCQALQRDLALEAPGAGAEEQRRIEAAIVRKRETDRPAPARRSWTWLWSPVPAAAVLVVVVAGAVWLSTTPGRRAAPPAVPRTVPAAASREAPPLGLPLEKPPIRVSLSDALLWRGVGSRDDDRAALVQALVPYQADDIQEASTRLDALVQRHPTRDAFFYLGACRLLLGRPLEAITALEKAKEAPDQPIDTEAAWYLAIAYDRAGRQSDARAELQRVCAAAGSRRAPACAALGGPSGGGR